MDDVSKTLIDLLRSGRKIEAIKLYRDSKDCDLLTAKEAVERIAAAEGINSDAITADPEPTAHATGGPTPSLESQVRTLLEKNRKIDAVKLVRDHTGMGLKESKEWVEAREAPSSRASGCLNLLLAIVGLMGLLRLILS